MTMTSRRSPMTMILHHPARLTPILTLVLVIGLGSPVSAPVVQAQQRTQAEIDAYRAMTALEDPAARLEAVEDFFERWPGSGYRTAVLQVGMIAAAEIEPQGELALEYAERYIEAYSARSPRPLALAYAARQLETAGSHPDRVDEWLAEALDGAESLTGRTGVGLWNAAAFIAHSRGDVATAIERQRRSLDIYPSAPGRITLARYLIDGGELAAAEEQIASAVIELPDNEAARAALDDLAEQRAGDTAGEAAYKEQLLAAQADVMLAAADDELTVKQTLALAFAKLGLLLDRADAYAVEIEREVGSEASADAFLAARTAAASVHLARGRAEAALAAARPALPIASPYAYDFHLARGKALESLGRDEEAIEAYLESAGMVTNAAIMAALEPVWERVHGSLNGLENRRERLRQRLERWHPEGTFAPPDDWSGRVVLAELFTGSECGPCLGADVAFDGLIAYYPPTTVAILVHHEHIPRPDPMTNPDTIDRMNYYSREVVRGTPTVIINGTDAVVGGGSRSAARGRFGTYTWMIGRHLTEAPRLDITISAERRDTRLDVTARAHLKNPGSSENEDLRLRLAVAEEVVHYEGSNGVTEHRLVVRGFIGGHDGWALEPGRETTHIDASWDVAAREAELQTYLETFQAENPDSFAGDGFTELTHEIDESRLVVVAFVQNETTKEIYQARVLDVR